MKRSFKEIAEDASDLIPDLSRKVYEKERDQFLEFLAKEEDPTKLPSEDSFIAYFETLKKAYAPSSLWSKYSMINTWFKSTFGKTLQVYATRLGSLLKKFEKESSMKNKAAVFTKSNFEKYVFSFHFNL